MRLEFTGVSAGYGGNTVLRDVDLVVPAGSVVALIGPNGAGKTTLLSTASGLVSARSGSVLLDDEDVTRMSIDDRVRAGLCHVTEGRAVYPSLSVQENLRMFSDAGAESEQIDRAIAAFPRLGERRRQVVGTMSGGEQQMLALARAYARRAPLVLLDEVSMGLAPKLVDEIFEFIARLAAEGTSLLLVEQYVAKALDLADLVYILARGRIAFAGAPTELERSDLLDKYLGDDLSSVSGS